MRVSDFFIQVNGAYRGTDDDAPVTGTPDHDLWLATLNRKLGEAYRDELWGSNFEVRDIGTVVAGTQSYDLDDDVLAPSDTVTVTTTTDQTITYTLVEPQERGNVTKSVYVSGHDPQTLTFYDEITSTDPAVAGTISMAGYWIPDSLTSANQDLVIDDPWWAVYAVAAELASNELTYEDKAGDLFGKANERWKRMVALNRRGTSGNPRKARTSVTRIIGARGGN